MYSKCTHRRLSHYVLWRPFNRWQVVITCNIGNEAVQVYTVAVLGNLRPGGAEGDLTGVNTVHQPEETLYSPSLYRTELQRAFKTILRDYTVLHSNEVGHLIHHLGGARESERKGRWIGGDWKHGKVVNHILSITGSPEVVTHSLIMRSLVSW